MLLGCLCLPVRCMKGTVRAGYSTARVKQNAPRRSILCCDYVRACRKGRFLLQLSLPALC